MKKSIYWIAALAALQGSMLYAQDITGTWQGTIKAGARDLRTVIKISKADSGDGMKAVMYSIDQGGQPIPANSLTREGSNIKMRMTAIGGSYTGRLSGDGNVIEGTWSQGPAPLTLNLTRATNQTAWAIPEPPPPPKLLPADAKPEFEVSAIKPSGPESKGKILTVAPGGRFTTVNTTFDDLFMFAYGIQARQITGAPAWTESDKFDITAKPDQDGMPNPQQLKMMVQKLLADRFGLKFHRDRKELSVYAIHVAKNGPKLTTSEGNGTALPGLSFRGLGNLAVRNATLAELASLFQSNVLDQPVVDQTGLSTRYDFTLVWTPDAFQFGGRGASAPPPADNTDAPPDLFSAIQQQLGLRLDSTKAPVDVLVIDHVEKPSEN